MKKFVKTNIGYIDLDSVVRFKFVNDCVFLYGNFFTNVEDVEFEGSEEQFKKLLVGEKK